MRVVKLGLAAAALAAVLVGGPAGAQPAGPVDPERLALAQKIYAMMGDRTTQTLAGAVKGLLSTSLQADAGGDPARAQALQAALGDSLDQMMPKVLEGTARIMAQDFSAQELRDMLAFYQSPTGQAVLRRMPEVTQQSMQVSLSLLPGFLRTFETSYCRRVACSAREQQAFAQMNARMAQTRVPAAAP
jgi:uncharacterized protein